MNVHRYEHVMVCGATAPGIVAGLDHEHECHQPARRPDQTDGVMKHKCHLCPVTWTEQTTNRMTLRPVDTSWVTTEPVPKLSRWSWVVLLMVWGVAAALVVGFVIEVTRG